MITGLTNGCFDLFHEGHLYLLRECRKRCDWLIVAIDEDTRVTQLKGIGRPVDNIRTRMGNVIDTDLADAILAFNDDKGLLAAIDVFAVNVLFKGDEYIGKDILGSSLARIELIPMLEGFSTTRKIREMMQ